MRALLHRLHQRRRQSAGGALAQQVSTLCEPLYPRLRESEKTAPPLLVIESLSWGGGGKSALSLRLAQELNRRGIECTVLAHGYLAKRSSEPKEVKEIDPNDGDETALLRASLPPTTRLWTGGSWADRLSAALRTSPKGLLLSDGGGWSHQLPRRWNLVILDLSVPLLAIPAGALRAPLNRLQAADFIWGHRVNEGSALESENQRNCLLHSPKFVGESVVRGLSLRSPSGETYKLGFLSQRRLRPICGLGAPSSFYILLRSLGVKIAPGIELPDHGTLSKQQLSSLINEDEIPWITTEKDAARLPLLERYAFVLETTLWAKNYRDINRLCTRLLEEK